MWEHDPATCSDCKLMREFFERVMAAAMKAADELDMPGRLFRRAVSWVAGEMLIAGHEVEQDDEGRAISARRLAEDLIELERTALKTLRARHPQALSRLAVERLERLERFAGLRPEGLS